MSSQSCKIFYTTHICTIHSNISHLTIIISLEEIAQCLKDKERMANNLRTNRHSHSGHTSTETNPHPAGRHAHVLPLTGGHIVPSSRKPSKLSLSNALLEYQSDLLDASITDVSSGVHHFVVLTESFYTTELIYHPASGMNNL